MNQEDQAHSRALLETAFQRISPASLLDESGHALYSGLAAFGKPSILYVLGLNPGGRPGDHLQHTVASNKQSVMYREQPNWSAYLDQSWKGKAAGKQTLQRRLLHVLKRAGLEAREVPISNLIFVRSAGQEGIVKQLGPLVDSCWPFHEHIIQALRPKVILCFGRLSGSQVRKKLGATGAPWAELKESNKRGWKSRTYRVDSSESSVRFVVEATHPSIAAWNRPNTDPSELIIDTLAAAQTEPFPHT
jgi:uracil-DNA glycosylase